MARRLWGPRWLLAALAGCCPAPGGPAAPRSGASGTTGAGHEAPGPAPAGPTCAGQAARVRALYRGEAAATTAADPDALANDNAGVIAAACARDEARVGPCLAAATSVGELERCLPPLDDEGSEGLGLPPVAEPPMPPTGGPR